MKNLHPATLKMPAAQLLLDAPAARKLDELIISEMGLSGDTLMELAGAKSADLILKLYPNLSKTVCICGKGNNGGDGLVVARHLLNHGIAITVIMTHPGQELRKAASINLERFQKAMAGYQSTNSFMTDSDGASEIIFADESLDWNKYLAAGSKTQKYPSGKIYNESYAGFPIEEPNLTNPDYSADNIIIDAIFGTGLSSAIRGGVLLACEAMNRSRLPIVSLDIASGLNATDGTVSGAAIVADHTFCMGYHKIGCYLSEGPFFTGRPHRIDLGFPEFLIEGDKNWLITRELTEQLPQNPSGRLHKYASGVVHVIGGSRGLSGAVLLAAMAAWKSGCGAVFVHVPEALATSFGCVNPQLIICGYGNQDDAHFSEGHIPKLLDNLNKRPGTVLLGPGLGLDAQTTHFVRSLMQSINCNMVVDADGIKLMQPDVEYDGELILTPHPGELNYITDQKFECAASRLKVVKSLATNRHQTIVSKGNPSFVVNKDGMGWVTGYDTRRFARAGFGDVLSGRIAGNWSQGSSAELSCINALWHGKSRYDAIASDRQVTPDPLDCL